MFTYDATPRTIRKIGTNVWQGRADARALSGSCAPRPGVPQLLEGDLRNVLILRSRYGDPWGQRGPPVRVAELADALA